jgi:hypothetical protein
MKWTNISLKEMYHFLGIILKISIMERDAGGYPSYFAKENKKLYTGTLSSSYMTVVSDSAGWAWKYMSIKRFKQIRSAFHPEKKAAGMGGDKCYQLRSAINHLNEASRRTFVPSGNLAFDEGGIACRSRLCPVRQYNKDKPDPYRVDFFVLADHLAGHAGFPNQHQDGYPILHLDVYQGANSANVFLRR